MVLAVQECSACLVPRLRVRGDLLVVALLYQSDLVDREDLWDHRNLRTQDATSKRLVSACTLGVWGQTVARGAPGC